MTLLPRKTSFRWKGISSLQAPKKKKERKKEKDQGIRMKRRRLTEIERKKDSVRARERRLKVVCYVGVERAGGRENTHCHLRAHTLPLRGRRYESTITWHLRADSAFTSAVEFGTFTRGLLWLGRGFLSVWWKARDELALWSNILIPRMELSLGNLDLLPKLLRASQLISQLQRCRVSSFPPRRSYPEAI